MVKKLKKTQLLELSDAYTKMLTWFFSFPNREVGLNDISEELKISKVSAREVVQQLSEEGFLKIEVFGKAWRISCNQNHYYNRTKKICYNLAMVYESAILIEIHNLIKNPRSIILFGSYRWGDDTEKSDIDIAVEVLGDEEMKIIEVGLLPQFGHYRKDVMVNIHIFSRNKVDLNVFSNIANGIVLEGFLEVKPLK